MGLASTSHYDVLEITPLSGEVEIKKAFHRIARRHHPDRAADGDVELFKRATIAYETLVDTEKRRAYDGELRRIEPWRWQSSSDYGGANPPRSGSATSNFFKAAFGEHTPRTPHTASAEAMAAAAAASAASAAPRTEDATYRRRPQRTRFSTRSNSPTRDGPFAHEPDLDGRRESDYRMSEARNTGFEDSNSRYSGSAEHAERERSFSGSRKRRKAFEDSSGKFSKSPRHETVQTAYEPDSPEEIIDLTGSEAQSHSDPQDRSEHSGPQAKQEKKRTAPEPEMPRKRQRTFDFSEMRQVPPFTEKHGTSFSFDEVNDAINSIDDHRRPRQYNRGHRPHGMPTSSGERSSIPADNKLMSAQNRTLFTQFTTESAVLFDKLFRMHNERVQLLEQPVLDFAAAEQSLLEAEYTVGNLLAYTQEALDTLRFNKQANL